MSVVSTPIASLVASAPPGVIITTFGDFSRDVERSIQSWSEGNAVKQSELAQGHSWTNRIEEAWDLLSENRVGKHARTRRNSFSDRVWSGSNRRGYVANRISGDKIRSIVLYALGPALGILSGPILARAMGPDGRGQFASIMQPITIASAIASIGIPSAIAVYIARGNSPRRCYQIGLTTAMLPTIIIVVAMVFYGRVVSERQNIPYATILLCWTAIVLSVVVQIRRGAWQASGAGACLMLSVGAPQLRDSCLY